MADWFYAKRYGYGASLPCSWQGWVVLGLFIAVTGISAWLFAEDKPVVFAVILFTAILIFGTIIWRTTKGGFKWRWGKDEDTI